MISFPPFRLDLEAERLWRHDVELHLRRKPFAILRYLVQNPRRLVPHDEIVEAVWGKIAMSESLLRTHVRDLRQVLGDGIVETVVGRGYRFTAEVSSLLLEMAPGDHAYVAEEASRTLLVGRDSELAVLRAALRNVGEQRRTTVFVTGEAGVGKSTLVDHFLEQTNAQMPVLVGRGACVEQYSSGQTHLPLLEAVGALCTARGGERVTDLIARHAPTWLAQMPGLLRGDRLEELQRRAAGATPARMSREFAETVEVLGAHVPVILVLEDLHWLDPCTAEVLAILTRRRERARCLVIATYRPSEVSRGHPLSRIVGELVAHRQASSIELEGLDTENLAEYLARRFPGHRFSAEFERSLLQSTGGNPLFLSTLTEDLEGQGFIRRRDDVWQLTTSVEDAAARRPDGILRLIDTQVERLGAIEQRIVETASVAGMTFTAGLVAHALEEDPDVIDSHCEALALERKLLLYLGTETWPDGTLQSRYAFRHALFRHAAFKRATTATVRARRRRMTERLEKCYPRCERGVEGELDSYYAQAQTGT